MKIKKTILGVLALSLLTITAQANIMIGGVSFKSMPLQASFLSISNGGTLNGKSAMSDGVGVIILDSASHSHIDTSATNNLLKQYADAAAKSGQSVKDYILDNPAISSNTKDLINNGVLFVAQEIPSSSSITCENAPIGSIVDGYLVVDNDTIITERDKGTDMGTLCTSNVTNMYSLFSSVEKVNGDITNWDVSHVYNMGSIFEKAQNFNQDISKWNVSHVDNMAYMFANAESFNQDLSNWNVSNVPDMSYMFYHAQNFNQDLSKWDVSYVDNMDSMFLGAESFNQDLSKWDVSRVSCMYLMFANAESFNQDLSKWNVSNVGDSSYFDSGADAWQADFKPTFN